MAGKPDLIGKVLGLHKLFGDLFLRFEILNQGTGPSKGFKVRLDLYRKVRPGGVEIFWYCQQKIDSSALVAIFNGDMPPDGTIATDFRLPSSVKPGDVGPTNMYAFTIVGPSDESNTANNFIGSDKAPPKLEDVPADPPAPPPNPWRLQASGIVGKRNTVVAHIGNKGIKPLVAGVVELHLRLPKAGAPTGTPKLSGSAAVPALQPSDEALVTVVGDRDFLVPESVLQQGGVIPKKKGLTPKFKTLIPFSLKLKGASTEIGFGPIPGSPEGKILFPGKK